MPTYNVNVFVGTYVVEATDEEEAEGEGYELCVSEYGEQLARNFVYVVEEQ